MVDEDLARSQAWARYLIEREMTISRLKRGAALRRVAAALKLFPGSIERLLRTNGGLCQAPTRLYRALRAAAVRGLEADIEALQRRLAATSAADLDAHPDAIRRAQVALDYARAVLSEED
jgi:hypothetical protein